ncbi:calcium-binding protein [Pseudomonas cannabina]|uniref:calcium-binding protein n=1 Tax=Pseudomonas cannabina TaxID=86840 RepID=UPI0006D6436D|nr:calcium-binding protein [Pseudomonas cannabina]KAA8694411.1 hypothetical protein F4W70_29390 [Pseudomonas cannabina]
MEKIKILEIFTGIEYFSFSAQEDGGGESKKLYISARSGNSAGGHRSVTGLVSGPIYLTEENLSLQSFQIDQINKAYDALVESVYRGLLLQTRLQSYSSLLTVSWSEDGFVIDYSGVTSALEVAHSVSPANAIVDAVELSSSLKKAIWNESISTWLNELDGSGLAQFKSIYGGGNSVLLGTSAADSYTGTERDDSLMGGDGSDSLTGGGGNDFVAGGNDNDYISGGAGADVLSGGHGSDSLYGDAGDDFLQGDYGNDYLYGGEGSDTYFSRSGWGQDVVNNYDLASSKQDVIEFAEGISPSDIALSRSYDDLLISRYGSTDRITVSGYFNRDAAGPYALESVRFAKETLIYSKTQLLPPDKSRPPERCRDEKSNKSAPP